MRPEDLREFTRKQPFTPFRLHITGGKTYDIVHPDQIIVLRSRVVVGISQDDDIPSHLDHVALVHIVRVEELQPASIV